MQVGCQGDARRCYEVRITGLVQGVGFRPAVWRQANALGLRGEVLNNTEGVLVRLVCSAAELAAFINDLKQSAPPLARIDAVRADLAPVTFDTAAFTIEHSTTGVMSTFVQADIKVCGHCLAETFDPSSRRYRYPFTTCTQCGPRLSIIARGPWDRSNTSMAIFALCDDCRREYEDPNDRRFHAEPTGCPVCGPKLSLEALGAKSLPPFHSDDDIVAATARLIRDGSIVAIKGLGGYQIACDATDRQVVERLRERKRRLGKPFALMARDLDTVRRFATVTPDEAAALQGPAGPIVLLAASGNVCLPEAVAPGLGLLGFMLPTTPLHALLLACFDQPLVLTSGNVADEPQCIDDAEARARLSGVADHMLVHDRAVLNRVDDSVVRVIGGGSRTLRRARGFAPVPLTLSPEFADAPHVLAMGGELKSTFCLLRRGHAILSQHQGDLETAETLADYERNLGLFNNLFDHAPTAIAVDLHPDYLATQLGHAQGPNQGLPVIAVQHHHAHVAAVMAEQRRNLAAPKLLGLVIDGLGLGDDGALWGGELLLADYSEFRRLGGLKPVAMPGGAAAVHEPWRNLVAHLYAAGGARALTAKPIRRLLAEKQHAAMVAMMDRGLNAPLASSCGRLFDAVAAALPLCSGRVSFEGEAAARLEALAATSGDVATPYPFLVERSDATGLWVLEPRPMWEELIFDLEASVPAALIAQRFHQGLANGLANLVVRASEDLRQDRCPREVVLSGGCCQNRILVEALSKTLQSRGFAALLPATVPPNDGGLALGQAAVAAARLIRA